MYDHVTFLEDLSTEMIREIFDYLAPHHLLNAFENLNSRFLSIITQHTLCLPESSKMSCQTYEYYMKNILPKYGSQFASFYFSEAHAVGSITAFLCTINRNLFSVLATSLRIITIVDITRQTFQSLIDHFHHFPHVHTLLIRLHNPTTYGHHDNQWNYLFDTFYLSSILKTMPQLRSLSMHQELNYADPPSLLNFNTTNFSIARHIYKLRIGVCSYQFLVNFLNGGHVPELQYLHVTIRDSSGSNNEEKLPFLHGCIPKLRRIHFELRAMTIKLALIALTDVYRNGQIEKITFHQYSYHKDEKWNMVSAQDLHRWLLLSSSKSCYFQVFFNITHELPLMISEQTAMDQDLTDFKTLFNASIEISSWSSRIHHKFSVFYPTSIKDRQMKDVQDHVHLRKCLDIVHFNLTDENEKIKMKQQLMTAKCFPYLRTLVFKSPDYRTNTIEHVQTILPLALHVIDRAPCLEEFHISWTNGLSLSIATMLSEMVAYNRLTSSMRRQVKTLQIGDEYNDVPFLCLVLLLINLFSDGNLEKLTFVDSWPSSLLQTFANFQQCVCLLIERLPKLIYLSIHIPSMKVFTIDQIQLQKWLSGEIEPKLARNARWRYRHKTLDLWF